MLDKTPAFNLKVVLRETGIKPDTLRAWERRYGLPQPSRTQGGHRLYSQYDIEMIKEGYGYTIPNPYVPRTPDPYRILFTIMPTEVENVLRGAKSAAEAAADMCSQIDEVLASGAASRFLTHPLCACDSA